MLDVNIRRKIDNARDILVGKIPDPKAQVEQITIALIYKFMHDMDQKSVALGGKPKFFTGNFEEYSWNHLIDIRTSGQERLNLYAQAVTEMTQNENLPKLFRDIFNGAFLPYRDPETLRLFLKEINAFSYDDSERLGDAYEYLLMILGAQGDAGQFRTPRHLIDFIVEVVDPQKEDTVLDPACGTAGFLISAYKHILKSNMKKVPGDALTPTQKKRIMSHFVGYDISPDMVRLSRVNMYLHGFTIPEIYEYDTLTSEERWNDNYDVILANPPFMSPKGGIRPHKRFSIQAKRSEVLFVDYMAEHLNVNGRAGFIVPEGIIFQSSTAYKNLRKMLVDQNYLYAVVSLPSGVFNPYSGVKTSILFLDKKLAKKSKDILFVTIENDGYELGAQRKPTNKNDLPQAVKIIKKFRDAVLSGKDFEINELEKKYAHMVSKDKIAKSGDYNLTGSRYKEVIVYSGKWDFVELGKVVLEIKDGGTPSRKNSQNFGGDINWCVVKDVKPEIHKTKECLSELGLKNSSAKVWPVDSVIISLGATIGNVGIAKIPVATKQGLSGIIVDKKKIIPKLLYYFLLHQKECIQSLATGASIKEVRPTKLIKMLKIPLPPLEVQEQIVEELDRYQKIIDGARQVIDNYKPNISIDPDWPMVELGDVCKVNPKKSEIKNLDDNMNVAFVPMADLGQGEMFFDVKKLRKISEVYKGYTYFRENDVLLARVTPCFENGKSGIARGLKNQIGFGSSEFIVLRASTKLLPEWIYFIISSSIFINAGKKYMTGTGGLQRLVFDFVKYYKVPIPPIEIQQQIVSQIEEEQKLVKSNKKLIEIFEQKIKDKINEVWGIEEK